MNVRSLLIATPLILLVGCSESDSPLTPNPPGLPDQGVYGEVKFWTGDFMPVPGGTHSGTITPVSRTLYIHEPATAGDLSTSGYFVGEVKTPLVKTLKSDADGRYAAQLPAGEYSIFVREGDRLYVDGPSSRDDGRIVYGFFEVKADEATHRGINILYRATF